MALAKGVNSYVTVAEADAYFTERLDVAAWTNAEETQKSQALVSATAILDELLWVGVTVSESQKLAFPRSGQYFDPRHGSNVYFDPLGYPDRLCAATFEAAYHLLNNSGLLDDTGRVDTLSIGAISLNAIKAPNKLSAASRRLIAPMLNNGGSSMWWRSN